MAGTILHIADLRAVAAAVGLGTHFIEQRADGFDDFDVGLFVPAANVVNLAQASRAEYAANGAAVILHIQPVAHLHAVAIHRQGLARERVDDHQRNQLFGKVAGTVIVRAIGRQDWHAISVMVGAHQVVAGGLAGRIRAVRLIAVGFGEGRVVRAKRAVNLVGRDMQQAKRRFCLRRQTTPVGPHGLQQSKGADDIGLDEVFGAVNRAIDMAFGGEVDDGPGPIFCQQAGDQRAVADVAMDENMALIALQRSQRFKIARVRQLVEIDDRLVASRKPVKYKICADKASGASDQNHGSPRVALVADCGAICLCDRCCLIIPCWIAGYCPIGCSRRQRPVLPAPPALCLRKHSFRLGTIRAA